MTPREAEAMAFTKAAVMMEDAKKNFEDKSILSQALRFNQLFWTILQADITNPDNTLPNEIKANIMSLSLFIDKQTLRPLDSFEISDLDVLIEINRNLAMGLRQKPADASNTDPAPNTPPSTSGNGTLV
ncbi:flagellar biosynthesis regulator FlaF [Rhodospira trueperi]